MSYKNIFDKQGNNGQDENTFYSLSGEFLEAARVLQATPPTNIKYSYVIYYLLGHSAELALKAFLFKSGLTIKELKNIGHDLEELINPATERGLCKTLELSQLKELSKLYSSKEYEYRKNSAHNLPDISSLTIELERLQSAVFDSLWGNT